MARLALVHPHYEVTGGAEAVSLNVIEALQDEHSLTLFTNQEPDFDSLNEYYNTSIESNGISVRTPPITPRYVERFGAQNGLILYALLNRFVRRHTDPFDLVVGTYNEVSCETNTVAYIHHPLYDLDNSQLDPLGNHGIRRYYKRLSRSIAGVSNETLGDSQTTLLTNSDWMGSNVREIYGTHPETVYPPIETGQFDPVPVEEKSMGFVAAGRISADKQLLRSIEILSHVRDRGHDITFEIAGPAPDTEYVDRVRTAAKRHDFVTLAGKLPRQELIELIERSRYAIHGKDYEHFGIVVAEFVAGGSLPFVPNSGGQREIVNGCDDLLYDSVKGAVDTIDRVLSSPELEASIHAELPCVEEVYGKPRFQREMRTVVTAALDRVV